MLTDVTTDIANHSDQLFLKYVPVETTWCKSLIQSATCPSVAKIETSDEDKRMLNTLSDPRKYAEEDDGQVLPAQLDYIYDLVIKHIKTGQGIPDKGNPRRERRKGKVRTKGKYKRYIYARAQDLFHKNPG
jgi:hypothetical protein